MILDIVSDHFGISVADLKGNKRTAEIANARQIVMYLCRTMTDEPLKSIQLLLGGRNHATILYGIEQIEESLLTDEILKNTIHIIKKKINPI